MSWTPLDRKSKSMKQSSPKYCGIVWCLSARWPGHGNPTSCFSQYRRQSPAELGIVPLHVYNWHKMMTWYLLSSKAQRCGSCGVRNKIFMFLLTEASKTAHPMLMYRSTSAMDCLHCTNSWGQWGMARNRFEPPTLGQASWWRRHPWLGCVKMFDSSVICRQEY